MSNYVFDVLVLGSGVAGLSTAIKCAENGLNVAIVTRAKELSETNTLYAQGGIIRPLENDTSLISDFIKATSKTTNIKAAEIVLNRSSEIIDDLLINKCKTDFERDEDGNLLYTREGAHSESRIIYRGDYTGKEIELSMIRYLTDRKRFPNISILTAHTAIDLLTPGHHGVTLTHRYAPTQVVGAYLLNQETGEVVKVISKVTVLATGGIGALYLHHSNAEGARGDGHAMAKRAGVELINMEFIQFHPTTFYDKSAHRRFLISEAVRGEGAILKNVHGDAFMQKYHVDRELAPRDVVARAILNEIIQTQHECVYLDISRKDPTWLKQRFPTIYAHCLEHGVDITKQSIPVVPAAHYTCGGIKTDLSGKTSLPNLYAVGEAACTGLHGANRLPSSALLEGLTWGAIASETIAKEISQISLYDSEQIRDWEMIGAIEADLALLAQDLLTIKQTMWNYVGLVRTTDRLKRASAMFRELYDEIQRFYRKAQLTDEIIGLRNAVEIGTAVLTASKQTKESVGCFYKKK